MVCRWPGMQIEGAIGTWTWDHKLGTAWWNLDLDKKREVPGHMAHKERLRRLLKSPKAVQVAKNIYRGLRKTALEVKNRGGQASSRGWPPMWAQVKSLTVAHHTSYLMNCLCVFTLAKTVVAWKHSNWKSHLMIFWFPYVTVKTVAPASNH